VIQSFIVAFNNRKNLRNTFKKVCLNKIAKASRLGRKKMAIRKRCKQKGKLKKPKHL
jgi:hypothetical protein